MLQAGELSSKFICVGQPRLPVLLARREERRKRGLGKGKAKESLFSELEYVISSI